MSPLPKATASNKQISMGNVFAKCYKNCVKISNLGPENLIQGGSLGLGRHRAHEQGVRAGHDTELFPFISIVRHPNRPVILGAQRLFYLPRKQKKLRGEFRRKHLELSFRVRVHFVKTSFSRRASSIGGCLMVRVASCFSPRYVLNGTRRKQQERLKTAKHLQNKRLEQKKNALPGLWNSLTTSEKQQQAAKNC